MRKETASMSRSFLRSNFLVRLGFSILLIELLAACTQQPTTPETNQIATAVAATLTAMPTATEIPPQSTVTPSEQTTKLLDRHDFQSVLRWVIFSVEHKIPEMLAEVIGKQGVEPFPGYRGLKGSDLLNFTIQELRNVLESSTPECVGYSLDIENGTIFFYGVPIDASDVWKDSRIVIGATTFNFMYSDQGWELVAISAVRPDIWPNVLEILLKCP
jgi:hypothetical protein